MKAIKLFTLLLIILSTSCNDSKKEKANFNIKEIAVSETINIFKNKDYSLLEIDTVIVDSINSNKVVVYVISEWIFGNTKGYFLTENIFYGNKIINSYISCSGDELQHCISCVNKTKCHCESCKDYYEYKETHPFDEDFDKTGSKKCDRGCTHGY